MIKKDKPATDKPVADVKPVKEPEAQEPKAEKPKAKKPAGGAAVPGETDQYGRQLYNVTCAACGKPTQVPFKPSGDRPVYCRDCYLKQRRGGMGGGSNRGPRR